MSSRSGRLCACMLFNSDAFIFVYLPIVLAGFYAVVRMRAGVLAQVWLVAASLYFYAYWNVSFLPLLLASIAFNYLAGRVIARLRVTHQSLRTPALIGAVSCNLILLGYFKYAAFLQNTVAHLLESALTGRECSNSVRYILFYFYANRVPRRRDLRRRRGAQSDFLCSFC